MTEQKTTPREFETVKLMAEGKIMTCLSPADRANLNKFIAAYQELEAKLALVTEARELCALMSDGEGSRPEVYRNIANQAMKLLDKALEKIGE